MINIEMDGCEPLDHALADQMAEERSPYYISDGQWVGSFCIYDFKICDSNITSRKSLQQDIARCDER